MGKKRKRKRSGRQQEARPTRPLTDAVRAEIEAWSLEACEVVGVDLVDVEYATPGRWVVRVYAERPGNPGPGEGITVDQCAEVSRFVEALMDADERVPESYVLEVSSPGVERPLKRPRHYRQVVGAPIRVVLREAIEGRYAFEGTLEALSEDETTITLVVDEAPMQLALDGIKRANVTYEF